jgi:hypothetical protein
MKKFLLAGAAAAGLTFAASGAQALSIGTTPASNDVIGVTEGWFGATWFLVAGAATTIDVYYLGKEAGFTNTFVFNGTTFVNTASTANPIAGGGPSSLFGGPATAAPLLVGASLTPVGLLDFSFTANSGSSSVTNATNTEPPPVGITPNFFSTVTTCGADINTCVFDTTLNGSTASSGNTLLLALDDGGAGPDDNHDDLVVVIKISGGNFQIPEPTTLGLLGAGLLGLGLAARRRRKV